MRFDLSRFEKLENLVVARSWRTFYGPSSPSQWRFQKKIVNEVARYYVSAKDSDGPPAAVVKMPTGTGKSAIMTLVANYQEGWRQTLVVVPSVALKKQIVEYLNYLHWERTQLRPPEPRIARVFEPSNSSAAIDALVGGQASILVCTTKTIGDLRWQSRYSGEYERLRDLIDAVLVDEGHREPAKTWSRAVRDLKKPTVLFTATPYRNDLRFFNIGKSRSEVTFQDALYNHKCIREITFDTDARPYAHFVRASGRYSTEVHDYVDSLFDSLRRWLPQLKADNPKVIVRCESPEQIGHVKKEIEERFSPRACGLKREASTRFTGATPVALGIHENFSGSERNAEFATVAAAQLAASGALFWLHQYKLMEGIDDHEFVLLSFCHPYSNARSLVQQIGRILRKPAGSKARQAVVHADPSFAQEELWNGYLSYELADAGNKIFGTEEIVYRILEAFPKYFYFSNKFGRVVSRQYSESEAAELIRNDLRLPKVTNILIQSDRRTDLEALLARIKEELVDEDVISIVTQTLPAEEDPNSGYRTQIGVFLGFKLQPSELLSDHLFFDIQLVVYTFLIIGSYLFYRGDKLSWLEGKAEVFRPVEAGTMQRLVNAGADPELQFRQASLVHSDPSRLTKRRRLEGGVDLAQTAPFLDDHLHVLSSVLLKRDSVFRYVGLGRARLSEGRGTFVSVRDYVKWAAGIATELDAETAAHSYCRRFARHVRAPADAVPAHLLCDLTEYHALVRAPVAEDKELEVLSEGFEEFSCEIKEWDAGRRRAIVGIDFGFIGGGRIPCCLTYKNGRFRLEPATKEAKEQLEELSGLRASALRKGALLRIITEAGNFYVDGQFFDPSVPLWGDDRIEALGCFAGLSALRQTDCEKEHAEAEWSENPETWPEGSIFRVIDGLRSPEFVKSMNREVGEESPFFLPEVMLCNDASGEIGDFLLYSRSARRIAVVHAKQAKDPGSLSAIGFGRVTEQVTKNLRLFDPFSFGEADVVASLTGFWPGDAGRRGSKKRRLPRQRVPDRDSERLEKKSIIADIQHLLRTGAERDVWIFYGQGFVADDFVGELKKSQPTYFVKHLAYLLVNCNEAVRRYGATLRVFTSAPSEDGSVEAHSAT